MISNNLNYAGNRALQIIADQFPNHVTVFRDTIIPSCINSTSNLNDFTSLLCSKTATVLRAEDVGKMGNVIRKIVKLDDLW